MPSKSLRRSFFEFLWSNPVKPLLERVPVLRRVYDGWAHVHPFDRAHGIEASGFEPTAEFAPGDVPASQVNPYGGSQPSIIRAVLGSLPDPARYAFVDIGCGKGRPLVVASEFPYLRVVGVELSPRLAQVARANAAAVAERHPDRTRIEVQIGDATAVSPPADQVVYFLYNSFGRQLVKAMVENVERQLQGGLKHAFFICYNPVFGEVLDQSPHFARWSAQTIPYADEELGYGPDLEDPVVVWQSVPERYPPQGTADLRIEVHHAMRCSLV
jgi:SAM-dependent methyltransferase